MSHGDSILQAISGFSPVAGWQETQAQSQPPATAAAAAATSAALAASAGLADGALAAATSAAPVAAGHAAPQPASHGHMRQRLQTTGQMLPPPTWVSHAALGLRTATGTVDLASRRNHGQNGSTQKVSNPGQQLPVGINNRGECSLAIVNQFPHASACKFAASAR